MSGLQEHTERAERKRVENSGVESSVNLARKALLDRLREASDAPIAVWPPFLVEGLVTA